MDKYKTRRNEWFNLAKEAGLISSVSTLKLDSSSENKRQGQGQERKKTALEVRTAIPCFTRHVYFNFHFFPWYHVMG